MSAGSFSGSNWPKKAIVLPGKIYACTKMLCQFHCQNLAESYSNLFAGNEFGIVFGSGPDFEGRKADSFGFRMTIHGFPTHKV